VFVGVVVVDLEGHDGVAYGRCQLGPCRGSDDDVVTDHREVHWLNGRQGRMGEDDPA
jgi:hypothetical protein